MNNMHRQLRPAAVAGMFYPSSPTQLKHDVENFLSHPSAHNPTYNLPPPEKLRALIVPHAGYQYSGEIAASAYRLVKNFPRQIKRVLLLGPNHRVPLHGFALPADNTFSTPLGEIPLDQDAISKLSKHPEAVISNEVHAQEHSLEVHLPFLQTVLGNFKLIPIVVGSTATNSVVKIIEDFWQDPETLIIISSDLSHFHNYQDAKNIDGNTAELIVSQQAILSGEQACGHYPLNGLLVFARQHKLNVKKLAIKNSGDTAGDKQRVVGYGAFAVYE